MTISFVRPPCSRIDVKAGSIVEGNFSFLSVDRIWLTFFFGFYDRDQLWTNDGAYRRAQDGNEYPVDLDDYPEYGQGWMNEEGVRIDMAHRLIPKAPLRSALKQPKSLS